MKQLSANYNNYNNVFTVKINIIIMYSVIEWNIEWDDQNVFEDQYCLTTKGRFHVQYIKDEIERILTQFFFLIKQKIVNTEIRTQRLLYRKTWML